MKLTIDAEQKTVEIDSAVNIKELTMVLKSMLPDEWKEYSIEFHTIWGPLWPTYPLIYTTYTQS